MCKIDNVTISYSVFFIKPDELRGRVEKTNLPDDAILYWKIIYTGLGDYIVAKITILL